MLKSLEQFSTIVDCCQNSQIGKLLPTALYVHTCALKILDPILQDYEYEAKKLAQDQIEGATLVKFGTDRPKISYLFYPDFDSDPHPALQKSIIVDLINQEVSQRNYHNSDNPPILHRKETFVPQDYFLYQEFKELTREEVALGLLDNSRYIGTFQEWQQLLLQQGIDFAGHHLVCPINPLSRQKRTLAIERHKAALPRKDLSRPVRLALEAGLFTEETTFFDYGCGYGSDVEKIRDRGYSSYGWDPYYYPENSLTSADIVNLGYIINVVEDLAERREALLNAWQLTNRVLIVSAQVLIDDRQRGLVAYNDGIITNRNTFQKYFQQEELKIYIDQVLKVDAIPASLGIYFVFKDSSQAEAFLASRFYSRVNTPRVAIKVRNFEDYQELLTPLMEFFARKGRLPAKRELAQEEAIKAEFGTYRRAFKLVLQATNVDEWDAITEQRRQDLLIYLALAKFNNRPSPQKLAPDLREDFKALFGSYKVACLFADQLLFSVGNLNKIAYLCHNSSYGKKLKNALVIHASTLGKLEPLLRLYEGCASRNFSRFEDANVIKLYCDQPKITYLFYPDFDTAPFPALHSTMEVNLSTLEIVYRDYSRRVPPLRLEQKSALITPDYPFYQQFMEERYIYS
ncbi:hypothetical protein Sta7437_2435 [Stanieria cyanosphaera PCC 7437]|uniref:DNA phosphorothioation-associated methyltransferase n=1 Tax=Stanieria cyanosphaera (strain ATCC 29371 / PCC 7437) TaxID=111780 RepID=K9XWC8_STAC7|nr:DNA phosphorothioation-associated putative methyltransferase [Stanieria cyanosphaera]AFZ35972.1 hypothetical protein Sta7437_2435 [Stanieria cyanosphaera PCC 7437]